MPDQPYTDDDLDTATSAILKASGGHDDSETFARYALNAVAAQLLERGHRQATEGGFARAVEMLRDDERYAHWWSAGGAWQHPPTGRYWDATARGHLADYLQTVGPWETAEQPEPPTPPAPALEVPADAPTRRWIHLDCGVAMDSPTRPGPHACVTCEHAPGLWRELKATTVAELLTAAEHRAMELTAELVNLIARDVIGDGPSRTGDVNELVRHIHGIQHAILAQAAARAYPERYRLLGGELPEGSDQ